LRNQCVPGQYYKLPILGNIAWTSSINSILQFNTSTTFKLAGENARWILEVGPWPGRKCSRCAWLSDGISAIISLNHREENRFVKFHALQSILLHVAFMVLRLGW
jgi:uncharacterized membrane protein